jgi:hypothetical protein
MIWGVLLGACPPMADYYVVIARAVSRLPSKTDKARHAIYERARRQINRKITIRGIAKPRHVFSPRLAV